MAIADNMTRTIKEGLAHMLVNKSVFYNPVQEFNRDLSVLVVKTYLKHNVWHHRNEAKHVTARGGMKLLDALSASGLRSIRYAKELGTHGDIIKNICANDISPSAVETINKNIVQNEVQDKVTCTLSDAIATLHDSSKSFDTRFHIIDLDPFGTGAQFFDSAVRAIGEAGLLMVTCTDTAVLCGNASESCFARYGSMSLRADFCHDQAIRIILRSIESHAAVYGRYIKPLLSISVDFYIRIFMQVFTQQAETKKTASKLSQVYLCKRCDTYELQPLGDMRLKDDKKQAVSDNPAVKFKFKPAEVKIGNNCAICGGSYNLGGPIWSRPIHDSQFLDLLKQELALPETETAFATFKRVQGMVYVCSEELSDPLFYSPDTFGSKLQIPVPKSKAILSALVNAGYKVSPTHASRTGFKTDAPSHVIWDIICLAAELNNGYSPKTPLATKIFERQRDKNFDFTFNSKIELESRKLSLLRFQTNPEPNWGPGSMPKLREDGKETKRLRMDESAPVEATKN